MERAHAHNDYEHELPLFDALDHWLKSVEADIWLVDGELLVAHDQDQVQPGRTLRSLYLDPMQTVVAQNNGSKLRSIVATVHSHGQRVRFWETPEVSPQREAVWQELLAARVDYIDTDHLDALESFLLRNDPDPTVPYVSWNC